MRIKLNSTLGLILITSILFVVSACKIEDTEDRSLFSWKQKVVVKEYNELFKTMESYKLNTVYQYFSSKLSQAEIEIFLSAAESKGIQVKLLAGEPEWALDKDGKSMVATIDKVININSNLEKEIRIKTVIFDIEPYLLKEWSMESNKEIMSSWIAGLNTAYEYAGENDIKIIICIPYYYDKLGLTDELESLIISSDGIAIMNYLKGKELKNIEKEVELANKYDKQVINIYELQAPGIHGLKDKNTYYEEGIEAIEENFNAMKKELPYKKLYMAIHEYNALKGGDRK